MLAALAGAAASVPASVITAVAVLRVRMDRTERDVAHLLERDHMVTRIDTKLDGLKADIRDLKRAQGLSRRIEDDSEGEDQ